jgi:hypothetical protein
MLSYYELQNEKKVYDSKPTFVKDIDEILSDKRKKFHVALKGRDRSNTTYNINNNFINQFQTVNDVNKDRRISFTQESNSGVKIPRNNPLCGLNTFNKFDDPNLIIDPLKLGFGSLNIGDANLNNNK